MFIVVFNRLHIVLLCFVLFNRLHFVLLRFFVVAFFLLLCLDSSCLEGAEASARRENTKRRD